MKGIDKERHKCYFNWVHLHMCELICKDGHVLFLSLNCIEVKMDATHRIKKHFNIGLEVIWKAHGTKWVLPCWRLWVALDVQQLPFYMTFRWM